MYSISSQYNTHE